jgi:hypothetical protein
MLNMTGWPECQNNIAQTSIFWEDIEPAPELWHRAD